MAVLKLAMAALSLIAVGPAHADPIDRWRPLIAEASLRFGIPTSWIERVMRAESCGMTMLDGHPIRSRAGAIGLMQLMPETWLAVRTRLGLGADPDDPHDNILAGTFYLRLMYERFGYPGLFAAYNAGPGRFREALSGKTWLPGETIAYLAAVGGSAESHPGAASAEPPQPLFALRRDGPAATSTAPTAGVQPSLFAVRKDGP